VQGFALRGGSFPEFQLLRSFEMSDDYELPKVWTWQRGDSGSGANALNLSLIHI